MDEPVFIAIEGIDASGKTTLTAALASALRHKGLTVAEHKEPSRGPVGEFFRRMSTTGRWPAMTMALLSSADRYQQQDYLATARQRYQVVLADRYYLSGLTYHAADGIDPAYYQQLNRDVAKPDAYLYLDITPALAATRKRGGPDGYWEERDFAVRLPAAYDACLALVTDTEAAHVIRIDASKPPHAVLGTALAAICALRPDLLERIGE
ncbi:MAG: dTMP kinase [Pseudonocardiaceae bacterium]